MVGFAKFCIKLKLGMVRIYMYLQQGNNFQSLEHQWGLNLTKAILEIVYYSQPRK